MVLKYHFIKDVIDAEVEVYKINTSRNHADILTKGILVKKFESALEFLRLSHYG